MTEVNEDKTLGFKWLKRKGGGKKNNIQFYESFEYDEIEYSLYDCVYLHKEGYPKPYIGKIIRIWEHADSKKVEIQWFFYAWEILNYLGNKKVRDKEIFLASGEGVGIANVNPLEAIAGKCNVVCISKDIRNAQPSDEELEAADYIFYRTFDVQSCNILDKMDEKVGGLEIQYIFNRNQYESASGIQKPISRKEDSEKTTGCDKILQLSSPNPPGISNKRTDGSDNQSVVVRESLTGIEPSFEACVGTSEVAKMSVDILTNIQSKTMQTLHISSQNQPDKCRRLETNENEDPLLVKTNVRGELNARDVITSLDNRESVARVKHASRFVQGAREEAVPDGDNSKTMWKGDSNHDESKLSKTPTNHIKTKGRARYVQDNLEEYPGKNASGDNSIKLHKDKDLKEKSLIHGNGVKALTIQAKAKEKSTSEQDSHNLKDQLGTKSKGDKSIILPQDQDVKEKLSQHENGVKAGATTRKLDTKLNNTQENNSPQTGKGVKSARDYEDLEGLPSKKVKVDGSSKLSEDKRNSSPKLSTNNNGRNAKDVNPTDILSENHKRSRLATDSIGSRKESKKEQSNEKVMKPPSGKFPKMSVIESAEKHTESTYQEFAITRRPNDDKISWFRELPWEQRLQKAYDQGTLVLLQNLDPDYTSEEVEDIIWHAFSESCTAKMVQLTLMSSPSSGQALIIFKTRNSTERVLEKLGTGCLMLSNGRPLVGSRGPPPNISERHSTFSGHLVIDKIMMQREMKDAVSTSHFSQPNTIEYEMAMEWCRLQAGSEKCWNKLYEGQREELQKLHGNIKQK